MTTPTYPLRAEESVRHHGSYTEIGRDLLGLRIMIVNAYFFGQPGAADREWVLIDAGMPHTAGRIKRAAARRFGPNSRPAAILLTHGHFDHVGALEQLAEEWDVPVFAHELELPYITGQSQYPPPDPTVGGGLMARSSPLFPRGPVDVGMRAQRLPDDSSVPFMDAWRWIATPGHTPGHVSFFRDADRTLIAGDAFVTTRQESLLAALTQVQFVNGPPKYYTQDWAEAYHSVVKLAALDPEVAATGHGTPMAGETLRRGLRALANQFETLAVPNHGRYVNEPAVGNARGTVYVPPPVPDPVPRVVATFTLAAAAGAAWVAMRKRRHD